MSLRRRQFQQLAASAFALPAASIVSKAQAQTYPAQPVRLTVGFAAGQAIDILARLIGQSLAEQFSQQVIVENKPGAGGNIAAEQVARATADGYTLLVIGANNPINSTLYDKLGFDLLRDFAPVAGLYRVFQVMVIDPTFPATTVPEFIAYAKANPGKINFGSAGTGSVAHVTGEWFRMMAGVTMQHVPYRGAPLALADLMSGQVQVMFDNLPSSIEHIRAGRLRALAVSTPAPLELLPGVPTLGEFLVGFETSAFAGLGAPAGTPRDVIDKLNKGVTAALADPKIKARILDLGGVPMPMTPAEFGRFLASETEKWAKVAGPPLDCTPYGRSSPPSG
ncbi:MAG: tripartite tricarboxylate transporter substrate binding protein [Rhodospirillales bacterium]|nr:tripartite tricarboxylate transporter substrate binding protein [Rhodospirillales bacterium]